ncbi:MAG TPA: PIN domain-containing protein [Verrucomicrobiae bacterium]|jgi:predicted nucleic acid-binding protein|nr:PIN domain-containing protein [Verrucomicrobiae bacterium]
MESLIDTCVWIDHLRPGTPDKIRQMAYEALNRPEAVVCEPVWFELLRQSPKSERAGIEKRLLTFPMLATPADLWRKATTFGQQCRDAGVNAGVTDLIIATLCRHHKAVLVTFDRYFEALAGVIGFETDLLQRPA